MARSIWTGTLGFGLVSVPVGLYSATEDHSVHFHQFEAGTHDRIRYKRVNERTGEEVPQGGIVRGVEVEGGDYVVITDEELAAIAPERSQVIEIRDFVDLAQIDPIQYRSSYYLAPRTAAASRPYALLQHAMEQTDRIGIALFVLRGREQLVAVRPDRGLLVLETMYFTDEVRDPATELPQVPMDLELRDRELETASLLIDSLSVDWDPARYHSTYREELARLVERKRHGETIHTEPTRAHAGKVVDLMEALEASLRSTRGKRARDDRAEPAPEKRTIAELRARASELGIPGRSKMNREQLARAVSRAEASERRAS